MSVRQAHVIEAKPVVDEEEVSPPILLAKSAVMSHHEVEERPVAEQRKHEGAENNQNRHWRHDSDVSRGIFLDDVDARASLEDPRQGVRGEHSTDHQERVSVERSDAEDHREGSTEVLSHLSSICDGFKLNCHALVRDEEHDRVEESNCVRCVDV